MGLRQVCIREDLQQVLAVFLAKEVLLDGPPAPLKFLPMPLVFRIDDQSASLQLKDQSGTRDFCDPRYGGSHAKRAAVIKRQWQVRKHIAVVSERIDSAGPSRM